jgi:histidinol-phosphate aminotransferase
MAKTTNFPVPNPGIMDIAPYVGGKSSAAPGVRVVKLSSNENPLGASPKAIEAFKNSAASLHRYPDGHATKLREAIGEVYNIDPARMVCGAGSDELIGLLMHGYVREGDEVLISQHGFLMYKIYAQSVGAKVVFAPEVNLTADVDAMLKLVTERTKIVFITNPNNPTGTHISKEALERLHAGLPPHVILAVDGAYAEYAYAADYTDGTDLANTKDNVVMLRTFSKIYGLSSLRLGWMVGPAAIIDTINRIRGPFNVSTSAIEAGVAAVRDTEFTAKARSTNFEQRTWLAHALTALGLKVTPSEGNFILIEFPEGAKGAANANAFLSERGLIVRDVKSYGLPNHLRITIGLEEDNKAVADTLTTFLNA